MMEPVSQEFVHAFVDGELAADEREQALSRLDGDPAFKAQVCELRTLKEMVRGGYGDIPMPRYKRRASDQWCRLPNALAAGLCLAVGVGVGWFANDRVDTRPAYERLSLLPGGFRPVALAEEVDPNKIILHTDSNDPKRLATLLDTAERLLAEVGEDSRIEIVVNSYGLKLLSTGDSPYRERIKRLVGTHSNLSFVACGQTVARWKREGHHVELIPEANVATSAIGEILSRMSDGWVYVKI